MALNNQDTQSAFKCSKLSQTAFMVPKEKKMTTSNKQTSLLAEDKP